MTRTFKVSDIAKLYAVPDKAVLGWIDSKELPAVNVARSLNAKRASWRITEEGLALFEAGRSTRQETKPAKAATAREKKQASQDPEYVNYF